VLQGKEQELKKERGLVFGLKCLESLAKYDQDLHLLRTFQCSLFGAEQESLQTLPKSGMMQNGLLSEQTMLEHGTKEKESGLLPIHKNFPTPSSGMWKQDVNDAGDYAKRVQEGGHQVMLPAYVKLFPTPRANDSNHSKLGQKSFNHRRDRRYCAEVVMEKEYQETGKTGTLNSEWVEWLMGYPIGWTDIGSENQKESQELQQDKQKESKDSKDLETL
jgi:hypothetical protein